MSLEKLIQIISEVCRVPAEEINGETLFFDDLGADSLEMFKIFVEIEEQLDAVYDREYLSSATSVGMLYDRISDGRQRKLK